VAETHNDPTVRKLDIGARQYRHRRAALVLRPIRAARQLIGRSGDGTGTSLTAARLSEINV